MLQLFPLIKKNFLILRQNYIKLILSLLYPLIILILMAVILNYINTKAIPYQLPQDKTTISNLQSTLHLNFQPNYTKTIYELKVISKEEELGNEFIAFAKEDGICNEHCATYLFSSLKDYKTKEQNLTLSRYAYIIEIKGRKSSNDEIYFNLHSPSDILGQFYHNPNNDLINQGYIKKKEEAVINEINSVQLLLTRFLIKHNGKMEMMKDKSLKINTMPLSYVSTPLSYRSRFNLINVFPSFYALMFFSYFFLFTLLMINEKEQGLQDLLFRQGVSQITYYLSWYVTFIIIEAIPLWLTSYYLHCVILPYVSTWLIFALMMLFIGNLFQLAYLFHLCLKDSVTGLTMARVFYIGVTALSFVIKHPAASYLWKAFFGLFPQTLLTMAFENLFLINNLGLKHGLYYDLLYAKYNYFSLANIGVMFIIEMMVYTGISIGIVVSIRGDEKDRSWMKWLVSGKNKMLSNVINYDQVKKDKKKSVFECKHQPVSLNTINSAKERKLSIECVGKSYDEVSAVSDVSCDVYYGEILCLLGHNGAGKSTLLRIISGLETSDKGDVLLDNVSLLKDKKHLYKNIGICSQEDVFFPDMTVYEHFSIIAQIKGRQTSNEMIGILIQLLGLTDKQDRLACELSSGEKRRLCIGLALIGDSPLVLLDEPTNGMDYKAKKAIWDFLKEHKKEKIIIITTHSLEEAEYLGDRIGIMSEGQYICSGTSSYLKSVYPCGININFILNTHINTRQHTTELIKGLREYDQSLIVKGINKDVIFINIQNIPSDLTQLFTYINTVKEPYGIIDYTIGTTSLEDVFLKLNNNEFSQSLYNEHIDNSIIDINTNNIYDLSKDLHPNQVSFTTQIILNTKRHLLSLYRNKTLFLLEVLFSIIIVLTFILSIRSIVKSSFFKKTKFNTFINNSPQVYYSYSNPSMTTSYFALSKFNHIPLTQEHIENCNNDMHYIDNAFFNRSKYHLEQSYLYIKTLNINSDDQEIEVNSLYNPLIWPFLISNNNYLLSTFLNNEFGIKTQLIKSYSGRSSFGLRRDFDTNTGIYSSFIPIVLIPVVLISLSAFNIITPAKERQNHLRQLLYLSGANRLAYWIGLFIGDTIKMLMFLIVFTPVLMMVLQFWMKSLLVIIAFMIGNNMFMYIFSFIGGNNGDDGQRSYLYTSYIGMLVLPMISMLRINWAEKTIPFFVESMLLPSSSLYMALGRIWMEGRRSGRLDKMFIEPIDAITKQYLVTMVQWCVYFGIVMLIEMNVFGALSNWIIKKVMKRNGTIVIHGDERYDRLINGDGDIKSFNGNEVDRITKRKGEMTTRISNLSKSYEKCCGNKVKVLDNIVLGLEKNEKFGLLGSNGAGKTTTFKSLINELYIDCGSIHFFNHDLHNEYELIRQNMGYCPQEYALFDYLTVRETLEYYAQLKGVTANIDQLAYKYSLSDYIETLCIHLSWGNKKKLLFAIAVMNNPKIILLDEPSTGVDPQTRRIMWKNINDISRNNLYYNMILSTHSIEEAEILCDRIGWLKDGSFTVIGNPEHLKLKYSNGYTLHIKFTNNEQASSESPLSIIDSIDFIDSKTAYNTILLQNYKQKLVKSPSLYNLQSFISTIKQYTKRIYLMPTNRKDHQITLKIILPESSPQTKDMLFIHLFQYTCNQSNQIEEMSIHLKSLEEIFTVE